MSSSVSVASAVMVTATPPEDAATPPPALTWLAVSSSPPSPLLARMAPTRTRMPSRRMASSRSRATSASLSACHSPVARDMSASTSNAMAPTTALASNAAPPALDHNGEACH
uniref:Uncharacterized protein n=1 Tax=Leersia perrieri TaxID=77586 RepID=A0A0D9XL52_9ORYZ